MTHIDEIAIMWRTFLWKKWYIASIAQFMGWVSAFMIFEGVLKQELQKCRPVSTQHQSRPSHSIFSKYPRGNLYGRESHDMLYISVKKMISCMYSSIDGLSVCFHDFWRHLVSRKLQKCRPVSTQHQSRQRPHRQSSYCMEWFLVQKSLYFLIKWMKFR